MNTGSNDTASTAQPMEAGLVADAVRPAAAPADLSLSLDALTAAADSLARLTLPEHLLDRQPSAAAVGHPGLASSLDAFYATYRDVLDILHRDRAAAVAHLTDCVTAYRDVDPTISASLPTLPPTPGEIHRLREARP